MKDGNNTVSAAKAADFLRTSNLNKEILRDIWLKASQTSPSFLTQTEFFYSLRLVGLKQNNFDFNSSQTGCLPVFNHSAMPNKGRERQPSIDFDAIDHLFEVSFEEERQFQSMFETNKDKPSAMSQERLVKVLEVSKVAPEMIQKIMQTIPFKSTISVDKKEFIAAIKLLRAVTINKIPFPIGCPHSILVYLGKAQPKKERTVSYELNLRPSPVNEQSKRNSTALSQISDIDENLSIIKESVETAKSALNKARNSKEQIFKELEEKQSVLISLRNSVENSKQTLELVNNQCLILEEEFRLTKKRSQRVQNEIFQLKLKIKEKEENRFTPKIRENMPKIMIESSLKKNTETQMSIPSLANLDASRLRQSTSPLPAAKEDVFNFDLSRIKSIDFDKDPVNDKMDCFPEF